MKFANALLLAVVFGTVPSLPVHAVDLRTAVRTAVESNPEIGQANANRQAIQFELEQARGLYLPKVDLEGAIGAGRYRGDGLTDKSFEQKEGNLIVRQLLFDGFGRRAEVQHQASRVDGASFRVLERSEFIGLSVVHEYVEVGLRARVVQLAERNLQFLKRFVAKTRSGQSGGTTSVADVQQSRERVHAAEAALAEARQDLVDARIRFLKLVGMPIVHAGTLPKLPSPKSLSAALDQGRTSNPTVLLVKADLDAAYALLRKAEANFYPSVSLEGRARRGEDLDGINGRDGDVRGSVVATWNLFNGGIDSANKQEQLRRIDEQRMRLESTYRDLEEAIRLSWENRAQQTEKLTALRKQLEQLEALIGSYSDQFEIGQRTLLDLLDTQNARLNAQVQVATAQASVGFAEYRILAAMGQLLPSLGIEPPGEAAAYARERHRVPQTPEAETERRREPRDWTVEVLHHREPTK